LGSFIVRENASSSINLLTNIPHCCRW